MRFPALTSRDFRLYLVSNFFALNANWILRLVIAWIGWDVTGSVTWTGILAFLLFAPTMISGPIFGVIADRVDIRKSALLIQSLMAVVTVLLYIAHRSGVLEIWGLAGFALAFGLVTSAHHPVRMSMVPRLVPRDGIANAVSFTSINFNLGRFAGPAIGGWLIDWFSVGTAIVVIFICYLPFIGALFILRPRNRDSEIPRNGSLFGQLADGAIYAWRHPVILRALMLIALFALILRGALELLPALADGVFHKGADGLGQAVAAAGAGALLSALVSTFLPNRPRTSVPGTAIGSALCGLALTAALGLAPGWLMTLLVIAGMGFCGTLVGVSLMQTLQTLVDDAYRGRVMSLWGFVGIGGAAVGAAVLGGLADLFGLQTVLIVGGISGVVLTITMLSVRPAPSVDRTAH